MAQDHITLGPLTLTGDLQWVDEYDTGSDLVGQDVTISITGAQIIQASAQQAGRRVTLAGGQDGTTFFGAIDRSTVESLRTLAGSAGATYTLTLTDSRSFTVAFRRDDGPAVAATPLKFAWPVDDADLYVPTIRLLMV